jgi:uncharacterized protein YbjT (DUF2867 family)
MASGTWPSPAVQHAVFVTGATGMMGRHLIPVLLAAGHSVRALARPHSLRRLPGGCTAVEGDALDSSSYAESVRGCDTLIHLVGVTHPSPLKAAKFRSVDLHSLEQAEEAAKSANVNHFIYLSVAHPAPVMKAYIRVREQGEEILRRSGLNATFLRPWYVIGPGRRWPVILKPIYRFLESVRATRDSARRLGLVTLDQMIGALLHAVEHPARGIRVLGVTDIRQFPVRRPAA